MMKVNFIVVIMVYVCGYVKIYGCLNLVLVMFCSEKKCDEVNVVYLMLFDMCVRVVFEEVFE